MRLMNINSLKPGAKLSTTLRMQDGRVLLPADATITENYIRRLKSLGILSVYISDDLFDEVQIRPCISDETKTMALNAVMAIYKQISAKKEIDEITIRRAGKEIVKEIKSSIKEPIGLFNMYAVSDSRCLHAVNVACIVTALALEHGCSLLTVEDYTTAALLHDIMLDSMEEDTGFKHAEEACEYLRKTKVFSARTYMSIASHHEQHDGMGGPHRLKGDKINAGAKMIAIADKYDNLVYGYNCKPLSLHQAVEYLNMESGKSLDPQFLQYFNNSIAIYPTGATVCLNNGYKAVVVGQNEKMPTRPKVRLAMPNMEDCLLFNLITQRTVFIESIDL